MKSGRPREFGKAFKNERAKLPTFLKAFQGSRSRPDLKYAPPKIRPDCIQVSQHADPSQEGPGDGAPQNTAKRKLGGGSPSVGVWGAGGAEV